MPLIGAGTGWGSGCGGTGVGGGVGRIGGRVIGGGRGGGLTAAACVPASRMVPTIAMARTHSWRYVIILLS
jgi:hypothetical protein